MDFMSMTITFDQTARRIDIDGRLHVDKSHISKAVVNPYYGSEIPGFEALGLEPTKIYRLLRPAEELKKAASTFERLPILSEHIPVSVDEPKPELVIGAIGSDVVFTDPYLDADLCFWDSTAIAGIESGTVKELSCAYRYTPIMEPGEGYDGIMTNIVGNHLALVTAGRAGSDVIVADKNPFIKKEPAMKMSKLGKTLFAKLCAVSPALAADSALPVLVGRAEKTSDWKTIKKEVLGLDSDIEPQQLDNIIDGLLGVSEDTSPAERIKSLLEGKVDEKIIEEIIKMFSGEPKEETPVVAADTDDKPVDIKTAMDSLRVELKEAAEAAREVRDIVGDVTMDSAAEIYGFALDHMKVDHEGISDKLALKALFRVANSKKADVAIAQDSAGLGSKFPAALRFRLV
jgi:uncharacterized protein